jgi:mannose-1-phosphate guanylyltransferase
MRPVIICGGIGTKMWPMSRKKKPKHFLPLFDGKSLFQLNYETLLKKFPPEKICIETIAPHLKQAKQQAPKIPNENFFVEPELRNHGPATGLMAAKLYAQDPDEPFITVQVDVLRQPEELWLETIEQVEELINKEGKLVTGGIRPEFAIMGVDYLIAKSEPKQKGNLKIFEMEKWLGRDSKEKVEKYLENKAVFTHANHYAWTPKLMLETMKKHKPEWYQPLMEIAAAVGTEKEQEVIKTEYHKMPKGPIEDLTKYTLVDGYVFECPFEWADFGTWESLSNYFKLEQKPQLPKESIQIDSGQCFVKVPKDKFVATIGVEDLVIVDSGDALLICSKEKSGKVKEIVNHLRQEEKEHLL